jgi:hypothetical protein
MDVRMGAARHAGSLYRKTSAWLLRPVRSADFRRGASLWHRHLAGSQRPAEDLHSSEKSKPSEGLSFLPTPGPGDSDGGDIFAP